MRCSRGLCIFERCTLHINAISPCPKDGVLEGKKGTEIVEPLGKGARGKTRGKDRRHVHRDIFRAASSTVYQLHQSLFLFLSVLFFFFFTILHYLGWRVHTYLYAYLYTRGVFVRLSLSLSRPDETGFPRIIKLAKYFRATAVITQQRPLVLFPSGSPCETSAASVSLSRRRAEPPASARTMDRSRNMDAHLSRVMLMHRRWTCLLAALSRTRDGKRSRVPSVLSALSALYGELRLIGFHGESAVACVVGGRGSSCAQRRDPSPFFGRTTRGKMEISMKYIRTYVGAL